MDIFKMVSLYICSFLVMVLIVVSIHFYIEMNVNGALITQIDTLKDHVSDLSIELDIVKNNETKHINEKDSVKTSYHLLLNKYEILSYAYSQLNLKNSNTHHKIELLQTKQYYPFYSSDVFDNIYVKDIYIDIVDRNLIKTTDVKYLAFVNILLYIDSLNTYEMIWTEVNLDESTQITVYQLDRCIYELLNEIKYDNFEIIMAGIFCLLGFSYGLQMIHKQKNVGYILSKKFANEFLHLHFNDKKYIDTIIDEIKNSQKEYVDSLHPIIKSVLARIPCNIITSEELQKNIVPIVDFTPKSVCNTVISVMSK